MEGAISIALFVTEIPRPDHSRLIVRLVGNNDGGGARMHCYQLNRALEAEGHHTLTFIPAPRFDDPLTKAGLVPMEYRHLTRLGDMLRILWPMRKDVGFIHSHLMRAALRGHVLAKLLRVPHVVTIHAPAYEGEPTPRDRKAIPFWRHVVSRADLAISISHFIQDHAYRQLGLTAEQARGTVVYNGTDDPGIVARPVHEHGPIRICIVGELTERKGMRDLLEIAQALREVPLGEGIQLRVFGTGPYEDKLRNAQAEGCPIEVMGYCRDPQAIFANSDLHMILSRTEAFGRVVTEAMAYGVPTLCYRAGAFPEIINHRETGMLVDTPSDIITEIKNVVGNPSMLVMMRKNCRTLFKSRFTVDAFTSGILQALTTSGLLSSGESKFSHQNRI